MTEILHSDTTNVGQWGNSLGVRLKQIYADLAGMNQKDTEIRQAVIQGKEGIFIGLWVKGEHPQEITEADLEKLQKIKEKEGK